ncbi:MAG TPA: hypothetical protein VFF88_07825, partial [Methylocella sp.]|nr:hypothetical protein [Methylocella sp.]
LLTAALLLAIFAGFIGSTPAIPNAELWLQALLTGIVACGAGWAVRRFYLPPPPVDPAKPGLLLGLARRLRKSPAAKGLYRFTAGKALPAAFLCLTAVAILFAGNRLAFDLLSAGGMFCAATAPAEGEQLDAPAPFKTSSLCQATGIRLVKGRKYRIRLDMGEGPDGEWFDKGIRTDVAGFTSNTLVHVAASPLKRWWFENWFAPIARIGHAGNYEHALRPAAPLPAGDFGKCPLGKPKEAWETGIASPAPGSYKSAQIACKAPEGRPGRTLISDITANATGELYLFVNDAVLAWPSLADLFYRNNSGTAKVMVKRIVAEEIIAPACGASGCSAP